MLPDEYIARARSDLAAAVGLLSDQSSKLFYGQHFIDWRDAEIKIEAIRQTIRQLDSFAPPPGVSLPRFTQGVPGRSDRKADQRSVRPLDGRRRPERSLPGLRGGSVSVPGSPSGDP
jgi:hypothetical protein